MKSLGMFRAVSIVLVASMAVMFSGCGVTSGVSSKQTGQHVAQKGKTAIRTRTVAPPSTHKGISREGINVPAKFEPQFKAQGLNYGLPFKGHNVMLDGVPPFASIHVERLSVQRGIPSILPNNYLINRHDHFLAFKYQIVDDWKAAMWGHPLRIEIYKDRLHPQMLIVDDYAGHIRRVMEIPGNSLTLINFTGFYVVFTPGSWIPGGSVVPIQAFNVVTGHSMSPRQTLFITGCFPCMGARTDYIQGLSQRYPNKPV